jgi:acyl-CoA thioesterase YciA
MVLASDGHLVACYPEVGNTIQTEKGIHMSDIDTAPVPHGDLALQTVAMPKDTNANGDIFGGWLLSQMDIAGMITASEVANGRVATVAVDGMAFLTPVHVGAVVS